MAKKKTIKKSSVVQSLHPERDELEEVEAEELPDLSPEDPMGLYADPHTVEKTDSGWGEWQSWAHTNKRKIYAAFFITIVGSFVYSMVSYQSNEFRSMATAYFDKFRSDTDEWVYAIGPYYFDENYLASQYSVLTRYTWGDRGAAPMKNDRNLYAEYLKDQLETDLLVNAALADEKILNAPEARLILENKMRHAIAEYYLFTVIRNENSDFRIQVTEAEIDDHYKQFKQYYASLNLDAERARPVIRQTLTNLKQDALRNQLTGVRNRIVNELKDGAGYRVKDPAKLR